MYRSTKTALVRKWALMKTTSKCKPCTVWTKMSSTSCSSRCRLTHSTVARLSSRSRARNWWAFLRSRRSKRKSKSLSQGRTLSSRPCRIRSITTNSQWSTMKMPQWPIRVDWSPWYSSWWSGRKSRSPPIFRAKKAPLRSPPIGKHRLTRMCRILESSHSRWDKREWVRETMYSLSEGSIYLVAKFHKGNRYSASMPMTRRFSSWNSQLKTWSILVGQQRMELQVLAQSNSNSRRTQSQCSTRIRTRISFSKGKAPTEVKRIDLYFRRIWMTTLRTHWIRSLRFRLGTFRQPEDRPIAMRLTLV